MSYSTDSFYISDDNKAYIKSKVEQEKAKGNRRFNKSNFIDDLLTHLREKAESKPKPPAAKEEYPYPPELNLTAWNEWKAYRRELKLRAYKPTPRSEGAAIKNLLKLSDNSYSVQAAIINQSIANQYQGLFELRGSNETGRQATNASGLSASQQAIAEARRQRDSAQSGSSLGFDEPAIHGQVDQEEWSGRLIDMD